LDAAEQLFAELGYESASLAAIGRRAGVSRGTPGYFFGTKQALYRAVIARVLVAEADLLLAAHERATATGGGPEEVVAALVETFLDFLVARPTFVRLVEREAAAGGVVLQEVAAETPDIQLGLATLGGYFAAPAFRAADPIHVLLSLLALCWFPLAHADTFTRALGLDPDAPAFLPAWKRHVVALVLRGLQSSP
ncbi:MAG: TetR family transcriptional regulator, partial [Chloroflexi bacterium]|nr:TetR family transcriptional regulator [Chloroflexota bacterium]